MQELAEILENNNISYENLETEEEMRELLIGLIKSGGHSNENMDSNGKEVKFSSEASVSFFNAELSLDIFKVHVVIYMYLPLWFGDILFLYDHKKLSYYVMML